MVGGQVGWRGMGWRGDISWRWSVGVLGWMVMGWMDAGGKHAAGFLATVSPVLLGPSFSLISPPAWAAGLRDGGVGCFLQVGRFPLPLLEEMGDLPVGGS